MIRIGIGVHIPNRDTFYLRCLQYREQCLNHFFVERLQDPTGKVDTLGHWQAQFSRNQGGGLFDHNVVLIVAALITNLENIAEALGRNKSSFGALTLKNRIRRQGRTMQHK